MINGAHEIIGNVPGINLDPLFLARSQTDASTGFIMIAYDRSQPPPAEADNSSSCTDRFYDLLFFRGKKIFECARLNQDLRFQIGVEAAVSTFGKHRSETGTHLFLFQASEEILHRFRSTFYYEPCLKVHIEALSKKQIITLLTSSSCRRGIIECNEFVGKKPAIYLVEIGSAGELADFQPTFKQGRLLLYDIEKNAEIVRERYTENFAFDPSKPTLLKNGEIPGNQEFQSSRLQPPLRLPNNRQMHLFEIKKNVREESITNESINEIDPVEFDNNIHGILNSPISREVKIPAEERKPDIIIGDFIIKSDDTSSTRHSRQDAEEPDLENEVPISKTASRQKNPRQKSYASPCDQSKSRVDSTRIAPSLSEEEVQSHQSDYIKLFERLLRSFRQQLFECFGIKCESVIRQSEQIVRFRTIEFDLHALKEDTALSILELIETIINRSSFLKRPKLRQAAVTLISDLYNKQYDLLEKHHAIDRVEQTYYRLKK